MFIKLILLILLQQTVAEKHWGYENCEDELDSDHWHDKYENCRGTRQSPIDIEKEDVVYDPNLKPFLLTGYDDQIKSTKVINDGHTVTVDIPEDFEANMIVPYLNATYKLVQFHFHWGHDDRHGSEHVVFKEHFPLEMHMVHLEQNTTFVNALTEPHGIVVLSVLFRFGKENRELNKLTNLFPLISDPEKGNFTTIERIYLRELLPKDYRNYLQYSGSLTTPPCNEVVQWIILTHTAQLSHNQISKFRTIEHEHIKNGTITKEEYDTNDRTIQSINERKVQLYFSFDDLN